MKLEVKDLPVSETSRLKIRENETTIESIQNAMGNSLQ